MAAMARRGIYVGVGAEWLEIVVAVLVLVLAWLFMRPSPPPVADAREVPGDNAGDAAAGNVFRQYKKSA